MSKRPRDGEVDSDEQNTIQNTVTLQEYCEELARDRKRAKIIEDEAKRTPCTYEKGPIRQKIYSCLTCARSAKHPIGVCFSCSFICHDGHEIEEVWEKRSFTCDCGTPDTQRCQKRAADCSRLSERNSSNEYNHNFEGRYCTCEKGFDWNDPDNNEDMLQCVYCEDWFHPSCEALERFEKGSHYCCSVCVRKLGNDPELESVKSLLTPASPFGSGYLRTDLDTALAEVTGERAKRWATDFVERFRTEREGVAEEDSESEEEEEGIDEPENILEDPTAPVPHSEQMAQAELEKKLREFLSEMERNPGTVVTAEHVRAFFNKERQDNN